MLAWVDRLLGEWADWSRRRDDAGLGYPRQTTEYRLMREGAGAAIRSTSGPRTIDMPEAVERVEAVIVRMSDRHQQVIREKYLRGLPDAQAARLCGMSVGSYRRALEQVHWYIAGHMETTRSCVGA